MLFWSVYCSWQYVPAIDWVLLTVVMIMKASAKCICLLRCFHFTRQCPSAATSIQACVLTEDSGCACTIPVASLSQACQWWLRSLVQDLRPQGGPVRKQTNSETPLLSQYVLACLLKVCQLLGNHKFGVLFCCFLDHVKQGEG